MSIGHRGADRRDRGEVAGHEQPPRRGFARLDWTHAFDLDGDGQYGDLLDPGAELPTPVDLSIDFTSSLEFRLTGSFSGTGELHLRPGLRRSHRQRTSRSTT
jgi:hypothetical protein